ncbi:MAG: FAD-dependent oxidoreductase [Cryomorphaceae bacterium]|nr:FAD-dependent oxidoreductase [Cryomorphaceae bacterium]
MSINPIIIVGAGIAGLTAANILKKNNFPVCVLESDSAIGGRVQTETENGFRFDRGFQVLLTEYPEAKNILDYKRLDLRTFLPGAFIYNKDGKSTVLDPLRHPTSAFASAFSPAITLNDAWILIRLVKELRGLSVSQIFEDQTQISTSDYLKKTGFSKKIIENFFTPFFNGIFLEPKLDTPHQMFRFVMKMFALGEAAIPAKGMGEIPKQLSEMMQPGEIQLNTKMIDWDKNFVYTDKNEKIPYRALILANTNTASKETFHKTTQWYFSAEIIPDLRPIISLNANEAMYGANIAILSNLSEHYAPKGSHLVSVSQSGAANIKPEEIIQTFSKFYKGAETWKFLKSFTVKKALPNLTNMRDEIGPETFTVRPNVYRCGDDLLNPSLNAAMKSGRLVAEYIING